MKQYDAGFWKSEPFRGIKIPTLREVLELAKGRAMVDIDLKQPRAIQLARRVQAPGFNMELIWISPEFVHEAHLRGFHIIAYTVDDPLTMKKLLQWGVDSIMTNDPATLMKAIQ